MNKKKDYNPVGAFIFIILCLAIAYVAMILIGAGVLNGTGKYADTNFIDMIKDPNTWNVVHLFK